MGSGNTKELKKALEQRAGTCKGTLEKGPSGGSEKGLERVRQGAGSRIRNLLP